MLGASLSCLDSLRRRQDAVSDYFGRFLAEKSGVYFTKKFGMQFDGVEGLPFCRRLGKLQVFVRLEDKVK